MMRKLSFKPWTILSAFLTIFFSFYTLLGIFGIVLGISIYKMYEKIAALPALSPTSLGLKLAAGPTPKLTPDVLTIAAAEMCCFAIAGVLFLIWMAKLTKKLQVLNTQKLTFSPVWAVLGFFIPLFNLFYFNRVIWVQAWKASDPKLENGEQWKKRKSSFLVEAWYLSYWGYTIALIWFNYSINGMNARILFNASFYSFIAREFLFMQFFAILMAVFGLWLILAVNARVMARQKACGNV